MGFRSALSNFLVTDPGWEQAHRWAVPPRTRGLLCTESGDFFQERNACGLSAYLKWFLSLCPEEPASLYNKHCMQKKTAILSVLLLLALQKYYCIWCLESSRIYHTTAVLLVDRFLMVNLIFSKLACPSLQHGASVGIAVASGRCHSATVGVIKWWWK